MVSFVPTPIGNLSDITLHALSVFHECEIVLCEDTRVTKRLFTLLAQKPFIQQNFPCIDSKKKKFLSFHSHNQIDFLENLTLDFFEQNIAFCTDAGMPNINDPGALLLQYMRKHHIAYQILLGGSAFSHAFVSSGLEGNFCFLGFLPHKQQERLYKLKSSMHLHKELHIIFYESPKRLKDSLSDIHTIMPQAILYIYKELTKLYEHEIIGTPQSLLENLPKEVKGEYCIIIQKQEENENLCKTLSLTQEDILLLDMSLKQKSKLLAQISNKNAKEWYVELITKT